MKRSIALAAGALALLGLAVLVRPRRSDLRARIASPSAEAIAPEPSPERAVAPPADPSPAPAIAPLPGQRVLEELCRSLATLRARVRFHSDTGTPYAPGELEEVMALERGVQELGAALARAVAESPGDGQRVIDRLLAMEDEESALRIARMIAGAVDDAIRSRLAAALSGVGTPRERRVALVVLAGDPSRSSLSALLHAAQADAEPSIRNAALQEARSRAARHPDEAPLIREVAATRAACEPDETARRTAASLAQPPPAGDARVRVAARVGR